MARRITNSHSCSSCDAEFDLIASNPEGYADPLYCPYCGSNLDEPNEEVIEWEDEEG